MSAPDVMMLRAVDQHPFAYDNVTGRFLLYGYPVDADTSAKLAVLAAGAYIARLQVPGNPVEVVLLAKGVEAAR